jgi:predicted alpha/beta-fold hydrolase
VAGVSLGGNALLRWLGEQGRAAGIVDAAVAVSAPLDLAAGGKALSKGLNLLYTRMFLQTLKPKALAKLAHYPGLFDRDALLAARDLYGFDNVVTAPLHGYRDTDDYWHRASARHVLHDITVPTLVLNARNDPFLPGDHLPASAAPSVTLEYPATGGHVGFATGPFPGRIDWLPRRMLQFFDGKLLHSARFTVPVEG